MWYLSSFDPSHGSWHLGFGAGSVALCLYLLPRIKGGVVAFQWARKLNGFGADASGNVLKTH